VLSDPGSASRMGKAGYRIIQKNFGIEKMLNETTGLYETLLNR